MLEQFTPTPLDPHEVRAPLPIDATPRDAFRQLRVIWETFVLLSQLAMMKLTGRLNAVSAGKKLTDYCSSLGLLYIKLGQLLSMRADIFPQAMCAELARLQDQAHGFPPEEAVAILEAELGCPINQVFSEFETTPWAAASIAQVHRAVLRENGRAVAVKVRRPGMDVAFKRDMQLLNGAVKIFNIFNLMPFMHWHDLLWELNQVFIEELDYRYEAANQMRIRKKLVRHQVHVPRIYRHLSTRRILVMDYVDGVPMISFLKLLQRDPVAAEQWLKDNNIDREVVGRKLLYSYFRQVFEDELFHADLHPGNIFLLKDNEIVLLDLGSVGTMERDMLTKYDAYLQALTKGEFAKAIDLFVLFAPNLPPNDLGPLKEELNRRLHSWYERCHVPEISYGQKSASWISDEMTKAMAKNGITIPWSFFKVLRGWTTLDTSLRALIPSSDLPNLMAGYMNGRRKRAVARVARHLPADVLRLQNLIDNPRNQVEMGIYQSASMRRLAQVFEGTTTRVSKLIASVCGLCAAAMFLGGLSVVFLGLVTILPTDHWDINDLIPELDWQIQFLLFAFFSYNTIMLDMLAKRFRRSD